MIYSDADVHMCWELENRFDWSLLPRKICESCEVLGRLHSAPPIAILECALAILSYCMQPTDVHIPNSYWTEPVVIWSFLGMPTGSSKSSIYKYLLKLTAAIQKELDVRSPYASSWTLNEAALEKMRAVLLLDHQKATVSSEVSQSQTLNQPGPYSGAQVSSFDLEMICLPLVGFSEPLTNKALIKDVRSHTLYLAPVYGDYDSLKIQPGEDLISDFMLKTLAIVGANLWIERQNDDDEALSQSNAVRDKLLKGDDSYLLFETETANKSQSNKRRSIPIEYTIDEESGMFKNIFNYFQHELKYFSHRDSLLSSLLTKAKGQVLRLAAPIHILVDAASSVVNEDYIPTNVISERSIAVAHALVKLSIAQTAFLSGRKINCDSLELIKDTIELEESVTIETPKSTTKNPFKSEIVILTSPGRIVSGSQLLEKKRFVGRDGLKPKEILTACVYSLEDDGLGTVENIRSGNGKTVLYFMKTNIDEQECKDHLIMKLGSYGIDISTYNRKYYMTNAESAKIEEEYERLKAGHNAKVTHDAAMENLNMYHWEHLPNSDVVKYGGANTNSEAIRPAETGSARKRKRYQPAMHHQQIPYNNLDGSGVSLYATQQLTAPSIEPSHVMDANNKIKQENINHWE